MDPPVFEKKSRVEKPRGGAQIAQPQVFAVAQILAHLGQVVAGVGVGVPQTVRLDAQELRLQFERDRFTRAFRQHEV